MLKQPRSGLLLEPDIKTYQIEIYSLDCLIDGKHTITPGYLVKLHKNGEISRTHFFTNKKKAEKFGKKYMKEEGKDG